MTALLAVAGSFLVGALPTGYLMGRLKGVDIRRVGSGNPGATNVFRTVGKTAGVVTLLIDALKGGLPVWTGLWMFPDGLVPIYIGLAAVAGHTWSPFLGFKGGKGVATSAGVFAALLPVPTAAALAAFVLAFAASKHVSVGSLAGAVTLAPVAFWLGGPSPAAWLAAALGLLIVVRHIPNIRRLRRGEEIPLSAGRPPEGGDRP